MWNVVLYTLAVVVGLILYMFYEPKNKKDTEVDDEVNSAKIRKQKHDFHLCSIFSALGIGVNADEESFQAFTNHFHSLEEISSACQKAGLGKVNLIVGVDFTASNEWQGRRSFNGNCLHKTFGNKVVNPYQKVISILGQTLAPFAENDSIPAYGFGDSVTCDEGVFSFLADEDPCKDFQDVLHQYNETVKTVTLGGPTNFAPIITKAIEIVRQTRKYHILVVIADGQVTEEQATIDAIVEASKHPISIIVVGVGDGPWDVMEEFDHRLRRRKFDNFNFVDYHKATLKVQNPDAAFALQTLMEIPDQYKTIQDLGYLDEGCDTASGGQVAPSSLLQPSNHDKRSTTPTHNRSASTHSQSTPTHNRSASTHSQSTPTHNHSSSRRRVASHIESTNF